MASADLKMGGKQTTEVKVEKYRLSLVKHQLKNSERGFNDELKRLQQHKANIVKFKNESKIEELQREHTNATLTIKKLRSDVRMLEHLKAKIVDEDREKFSKQVGVIQTEVERNVEEFLAVHGAEIVAANTPAAQPSSSSDTSESADYINSLVKMHE
jgi:hypothetical protein